MILIHTFTCPTTSAVQLGKASMKNSLENPLPDFVKLTGPFITVCEDGYKAYAILEIENGKEDEAFKIFNKRLANYMSVPGLRCKEERLLTREETVVLLGLEGP